MDDFAGIENVVKMVYPSSEWCKIYPKVVKKWENKGYGGNYHVFSKDVFTQ